MTTLEEEMKNKIPKKQKRLSSLQWKRKDYSFLPRVVSLHSFAVAKSPFHIIINRFSVLETLVAGKKNASFFSVSIIYTHMNLAGQ